jgi:hypothetical protein
MQLVIFLVSKLKIMPKNFQRPVPERESAKKASRLKSILISGATFFSARTRWRTSRPRSGTKARSFLWRRVFNGRFESVAFCSSLNFYRFLIHNFQPKINRRKMNQSAFRNDFVIRSLFRLSFFSAMILLSCVAVAAQSPPSFVQQAKLEAADGVSQDQLGFSVAVSGDTAVVGAPRNGGGTGLQNRGAVYVYTRGVANWTLQQKLTGSDSAATDQFGYSVAVSGDTIAVGRYNTTTGQNRADGKVYVFTRSGNVWTETQTLVASDVAQGDLFGNALAFDGDTLVVGALNKTNGTNFFQGAAYVFTRPAAGGSFTQQAKLLANDGAASDFFGYSLAISGDSIIVGAPAAPITGVGKAYVFARSGANWSQQQKLTASDGAAGDAFGFSVGISGDYAIIGARLDDNGAVGDQGSAYIFARSGANWSEQQKLLGVEITQRNDQFGSAVAIRGATAIVGAPAHEIVSNVANHGAVYVFTRSGANWTRAQKIVHNDPNPDALAQAVAFDGNSILSGAPSKNSSRGAAYVFNSTPTDSQFKLYPPEVFIGTNFGSALAISEDTTAISSNLGTYIYTRRGGGWEFTQKLGLLTENGGATSINPNSAIAFSGNMMIVGAQSARINNVNGRGAVLVYTRNNNGVWVEQQRLLAADGAANDFFGSSLAATGNTLVVGANNDAIGSNAGQGSAYVFTFNGTSWSEQQKLIASNGAANDRFGSKTAISGETIVVGAPIKTVGSNSGQGAAYVFVRNGSSWSEQARLQPSDGGSDYLFGTGVAIEADTIVVGANQATGAGAFQGAAYVFTRVGTIWTERQKLFDASGKVGDNFGIDVAISGDRLYVGASGVDFLPNWEAMGAVYVYGRNNQSWRRLGKLYPFDTDHNKQMGYRVAISGGYLATTAIAETNYGVFNSGAGYVFDLSQIRFGAPDFDFDGDGKADFSVYRGGTWFVNRSTNNQFAAAQFGAPNDRIAPADYDGDGKTDFAVYRDGSWFVLRSSDNQFSATTFGAAEDIPVPADYDGDGKADIAVFRPSNGTWYRLNSTDGSFSAAQFGAAGDKPATGDFDGDGKADLCVYRPAEGIWYRLNSSNGAFVAVNFGVASDLVVPADYDGDGKTDIAVFRPADGFWYRLNGSNGSFSATRFGASTDLPVPADYDGDGKTDIAVFRGGNWFVMLSGNNQFAAAAFGTNGDAPIPNAFVR